MFKILKFSWKMGLALALMLSLLTNLLFLTSSARILYCLSRCKRCCRCLNCSQKKRRRTSESSNKSYAGESRPKEISEAAV